MARPHSGHARRGVLIMKATVLVQPPGHAVIVEHESIQTLVLASELTTTVVDVPGPQGPPGPEGAVNGEPDVPDLTILFENGLL